MQDCFCSQRLQASGFRLGMLRNSGFHLPGGENGVERREERPCVGLCFFTVTLDLRPGGKRDISEKIGLKSSCDRDFHRHKKH